MKVLIYTASSLCNPQFGIQMDHAIEYAKDGNKVVFCYCAGAISACSANPLKNKAFCKACNMGFRAGLKNLPSNIKLVGMKNLKHEKVQTKIDFKSVADIKAYRYKGVDVGFSALSVYVSKTRNPNPHFSDEFLDCINKLIWEAEKLVDSADNVVNSEKPDLILFFNGRFFDTKPFHHLAEKYNISYIATENIGGVRTGDEYRIMQFHNTIPHDSLIYYKYCLKSWDISSRPVRERIEIGESFYKKRRNGEKAGDYAYTASQIIGKLPKDYNSDKKNIVVFTSSEDEFSSISSKVDGYFIFSSQYECIKYMSENINDDSYHFIVRIHPNMKGLTADYHKNLYLLTEKKNVTIIPPEDDTSSYTLMDIAYNVVVFGSTIGAESMFWGKSVVLLGFAAYYEWRCCSIPHDKEEILEFVKHPKVYSNAKELATKFGYYVLENNIAQSSKHVDITPRMKKILGKDVYVFGYIRLLNSPSLFRLISTLIYRCFALLYKNNITFPETIIH